MKQLYWSRWRGILKDHTRRYVITEATDGFVVADTETGEIQRCQTLQVAKAWAEARFGGRIVHQAGGRLERLWRPYREIAGNERAREQRRHIDRRGGPGCDGQ